MGYYQDVDEARDTYDDYNDHQEQSLSVGNNWGERSSLPKSKKSAYIKAKKGKVGEDIKCANCGKTFKKQTYQQKFCSDKCRVKYHNRRLKQ